MSFDWQQASKERYFRMTEERIEAAGFGDFLHIDRTAFGTVAGKTVKVYMEKIHRIGNVRRWQQARKAFPELKECTPPRNSYGKKEKPIFLHGYFEIEMEAGE